MGRSLGSKLLKVRSLLLFLECIQVVSGRSGRTIFCPCRGRMGREDSLPGAVMYAHRI